MPRRRSRLVGWPAARAEPEERDLAGAELVAGGLPDAIGEVAEGFVVDVHDGPAALADEMVVRVFAGRLVVGAVGSEVGPQEEALLDEKVERAVDGRGVDPRKLAADALCDLVGAQVLIRLGEEDIPDRLALTGEPPAAPPEAGGMRRRAVFV